MIQYGLSDPAAQVHKAEKYTWFEKLLANSDATFVQVRRAGNGGRQVAELHVMAKINPASRPLRTVGPYKANQLPQLR